LATSYAIVSVAMLPRSDMQIYYYTINN